MIYHDDDHRALLLGDCRAQMREHLADAVARTCVTSPPYYGLRDYGVDGQIGLEQSPEAYVDELVSVFREVRRVLTDDGTLWLNLGDSYAGGGGFSPNAPSNQQSRPQTRQKGAKSGGIRPTGDIKSKDLIGIPWMVAFALRADGWYLRSEIIWHKPNPMPESVKDRPTKAHEHVFLFAKSERYFYDADAIREPYAHPDLASKRAAAPDSADCNNYSRGAGRNDGGPAIQGHGGFRADPGKGRNKRDVWTITPKHFKGAHFATMPPDLAETCVLAGSAPGDVVLDPFCGAGTTGLVASEHGRGFVGTELNPEYAAIAVARWVEGDAR